LDSHNLGRFGEYLAARSLVAALVSDPATLTWLTGYAPPIEAGPNPFEGGPALAWIRAGSLTLIVSDAEAPAARQLGIPLREYLGYTIDHPVEAFRHQADVLETVLDEHRPMRGTIGIEPDTLPARMLAQLEHCLPEAAHESIELDLSVLRAIKSAEEITRIRGALELCDLAHALLRQRLQPGMTELDLWNQVRAGIEGAAGSRIPALVDVVAGARAAEIGGPPTARVIRPGDPVILDVVLRRDGYWGDTAGTWFAGPPSPEMARAHRVVRDALHLAVEAVRPGVQARELDRILREAVARFGAGTAYPHHSGHGIGTTYHDRPRVVPYETMRLEPGMVITLEPGIYLSGVGGVRLEDVVLVTTDGCELLTGHLLADEVVSA
jgi:Xaa-Pro aminopeptidase